MSNASLYDRSFFESVRDGSSTSAAEVIPLVLRTIKCKSVIDVGCGIGTWLTAFLASGITDIIGVDGSYVDRTMLQIDPKCFLEHDLTTPLHLKRRFDLALCLEVAEHLPESSAEILVDSLIGLSNQILFSAAIPGQPGTGHINPQWQSYWISKFESRGYACIDCIRPTIWRNTKVDYWYAQNSFLFVNENNTSGDTFPWRHLKGEGAMLKDILHPIQQVHLLGLLEKSEQRLQWAQEPGLLGLLKQLPAAGKQAILRRLRP